MTWHDAISAEIAMEFWQPSPWQMMELQPTRVRRMFGLPSDDDIKRRARAVKKAQYQIRYAKSEKGRAAIARYAMSERGIALQRARDKRAQQSPKNIALRRARQRRSYHERKGKR